MLLTESLRKSASIHFCPVCVYCTEFTLREKLSQEVADLKAELECAKKSKGRKSLAPKLKDVVCTASKAGKPEDVGDFPSTTVKGSDRPTETRSSTSKEEEAGAEETPKAGEDKENSVNVDSAKMVSTSVWLANPCKLLMLKVK